MMSPEERNVRVAFFDVCHTLVGMTTIKDFTEKFLLSPEHNQRPLLGKKIFHIACGWLMRLNLIDKRAYRKHFIWLFSGYTDKEIAEMARKYNLLRINTHLKSPLVNKLAELKNSGYKVFLVSAGLDVYLEQFAEHLGVGLVCTRLEKDSRGVYTGRVQGLDCTGTNKVAKIKSEIPFANDINWKESFAFGDNMLDVPMLSLVGNAYVVDPKASMRQYAIQQKWGIIETIQ